MAELATRYVDKMATLGGECDFAQEIAIPYPLTMITTLLGLPESDNELVLKLTQELFHATDPNASAQVSRPVSPRRNSLRSTLVAFFSSGASNRPTI